MNSQKIKILVGCPTSEAKRYCLQQYYNAVKSLTYSNIDFWMVDNSINNGYFELLKKNKISAVKDEFIPNLKERIVQSRNILRQKILDGGYDYFLSLEQDVIPQPNIIERLLAHGKDIVSGVYYGVYYKNDKPTLYPLVWEKVGIDDEAMRFMVTACKQGRESKEPMLREIKACGLGCVLISRKVLEKVSFKTDPQEITFDDIQFCKEAAEKGFKLYADVSVHCQHILRDQFDTKSIYNK